MLIKTIFSGFGGQGVLSMGNALSTAAMLEGKHVTYFPAYGAEVRGGTANCTVSVSDEEIASPVASEPEFVIAMNQPSFVRFQNLVVSGGLLLVNSSMVNVTTGRGDIEVVEVPTSELAEKLGNIRVANMVMLGAFIRVSTIVSFARLIKNLPAILGAKRERFLKINQEALEQGHAFVKEWS
jgi:2-oxoglutarate ferredoxin oxidoreductase subunit gamma